MPKAVLQKFCQKLGWEAPKYNKISERDGKFVYSVDVLRGAAGRGKSRKAGGLTKIQLPELDEEYGFVQVTTFSVTLYDNASYKYFRSANYYSDMQLLSMIIIIIIRT